MAIRTLSTLAAVTVALMIGTAAAADTDQVILGKTVTKDEKAAALVPAKLNGALRAVTAAGNSPWIYFDDKNELTGIEIDVARTVAAKLGVKITFENIKFEGVIPSLQAGKADIITAGMGDSEKREEILNFINYTTLGLIILVPENEKSINRVLDLCGKTVSRMSGDAFGPWIADKVQIKCEEAGKEKIEVKTLPDAAAALLAVKSGSVDAQITSLVSATSVINNSENAGLFRIIRPENSRRGWKLANGGFGVLKSETELTKAIEAGLKSAEAEGALQAIADHYGYPDVIIDNVVVNKPVPDGNKGAID